MAGFQVSINGRFWVSTEATASPILHDIPRIELFSPNERVRTDPAEATKVRGETFDAGDPGPVRNSNVGAGIENLRTRRSTQDVALLDRLSAFDPDTPLLQVPKPAELAIEVIESDVISASSRRPLHEFSWIETAVVRRAVVQVDHAPGPRGMDLLAEGKVRLVVVRPAAVPVVAILRWAAVPSSLARSR